MDLMVCLSLSGGTVGAVDYSLKFLNHLLLLRIIKDFIFIVRWLQTLQLARLQFLQLLH